MNEFAKQADILKTGSGDLKNNIFSAKIELDNLRANIGGIVLEIVIRNLSVTTDIVSVKSLCTF